MISKLPFDTHMDFVGQKRAERLYQIVIVIGAIVGFIHGYIEQRFSLTMYYTLSAIGISALLVVPPWPWFRLNPIKWRKTSSGRKSGQHGAGTQQKKKGPKDTKKKD
ncbi:hypothetical protein ACOME3_001015 [Neoechinorhynchus agilis]